MVGRRENGDERHRASAAILHISKPENTSTGVTGTFQIPFYSIAHP